MATRKLKNPELNKTVDNLQAAAHHLRNAVQTKLDEVRGNAAAELVKVKALARKNTEAAHGLVETAIGKAELRLHRAIDQAQAALDKAVQQLEQRRAPEAGARRPPSPPAVKRRPATKAAPGRK